MTRALSKAIMTRSRFKNVYLKDQDTTNLNNYKYHQNVYTNLLRKTKFDYFRNLNVKYLHDNEEFWKKSNLSFQIKILQVVILF